jgi:putative tricarboxylic transport membrane protein
VRRADQVTGILLLALSVWFGGVALQRYTYWSPTGPGSGFLPVWLSLAMAALAVTLIVKTTRSPDAGAAWLPDRRVFARLLAVVGATAAFIALMPLVGMILGSALFIVVLLRGLEGYAWGAAVGVAAAAAAVNYLVFTYWLGVPFPTGVLGF